MVGGFPLIALLTFAGVLLAGVAAILAIRSRPDPLAIPLVVLMGAVGFWGVTQGISFSLSAPTWVLAFDRVGFIGAAVVPVAFYVFAARYAGYERWIRQKVIVGVSLIPAISLGVMATNSWHGWFWASAGVDTAAGVSVVVGDPGWWFWVYLGWAYLLVLFGLAVLGNLVVRSEAIHRRQSLLVFVGALIPFLVNVGHFAGIGQLDDVNLTPVAFSVTGVIFVAAIYAFDLIELRPVAREWLFGELRDGILVVDADGRVRDMNPTAAHILESAASGSVVGDVRDNTLTAGSQLRADIEGETRYFRVDEQPIHDRREAEVGRVMYLRDVTGIAQREQRISVLHRVLRHNIRNELNLIQGHVESARAEVDGETSPHLRVIDEASQRILSIAENARLVERTIDTPPDSHEEIDLVEPIEHAVSEISDGFPDAEIDVTMPEHGCTYATVVDPELIEQSVVELLENGLVHGSGETGPVDVRLVPGEGEATVEIVDEGEGIPQTELDALSASEETALRHGSGMGLWLTRWAADVSDGELGFEVRNGSHTARLRLPCDRCEDTGSD